MFAFAHDLRSYLRTIRTRLELAQSGASSKMTDDARSLLAEAAGAAREIDSLLNAMVAYCSVRPSNSVTSLSLIFRGLLIEQKSALASAGAEIGVANSLDLPAPAALSAVLGEVVTNACKFRDSSRPLRIRIETRLTPDNTLEVSVSDNGLGIAPSDLERIFAPFHRLHSQAEFPGHGLGLALCRRIAQTWGGDILAQSRAEGGATFVVTVPDIDKAVL
jgi:signal transduction histidine kinase